MNNRLDGQPDSPDPLAVQATEILPVELAPIDDDDPDHRSLHAGLWSGSFQGLLWTQWLTAVNDNVFRWFVIGVGKDQFTPENVGTLLVVGSSFFIIPYILFASVAGWLADRFAKSRVIVGCKIAEIVIMGIGVWAVSMLGEPDPANKVDVFFYVLLGAVFLMGMQSALFAPAKVGTIPELLDERTIAAGNGIFNLATLSATVIGMALGGWLSDYTSRGQERVSMALMVLVGIAVIGTVLSLLIRTLPAANQSARFPYTLIGETVSDIVHLFRHGRLFRVALGIVFFWSIAAFAQLNIDFFSEESGGLAESHRTPLLIAVTLGIGLGSVMAGIISAGRIELGLVPWGALGIAVFAFALAFSPEELINAGGFTPQMTIACLLLAGMGMGAGIFDVPLASYLQHNSPIKTRGSILAATNCLAFSGILLMFGLLLVLRQPSDFGSLNNVASVRSAAAQLDANQRAQIDQLVAEYQSQPDLTSRPPEIEQYLQRVGPELRDVALAELVFADASARSAQSQSILLKDYTDRFPVAANQEWPPEAWIIKPAMVQSGKQPLLTSRQVFLAMGLMALPVFGYATWRLAKPMVRLMFLALFYALYRIRINHPERVPNEGGGLVIANHTSWLDGAIMLTLVPRIPRTIAWSGNFSHWMLEKWADFCGVILISGGPKSIKRGLNAAKGALDDGQLVGLFPEGGISRSGQTRTFRPGLSKIVDLSNPSVPIIPAYFDETWGSLFSHYGGRAFNRLPWPLRRPLSVHFGKPIRKPVTIFELQQAIQRLSTEAVEQRKGKFTPLAASFIKACKKKKFQSKIGDSTGAEEKGGTLLTRALVLKRLLQKHVLAKDEQHVGVLIPPSVGGTIVNVALALDRRIAVNLNYSLSNELINYCIAKAGIKHVLTTRKVMDKFKFELDCEVYYLDDLKEKVTSGDKIIAALQSYAVPAGMLSRWHGLHRIDPDEVMTIVFTSGSTGVPKGVQLTQRNLQSNVDGIEHVASFRPDDTMVGILPFFHSMGYTATLWAPMACNIRGVYHFSPLDAKIVGKLVEKFAGTIIVATPTFLRSYMRRCTPEQFKTLDAVVAGAERLPPELCEEFEQKFGVRPVEGYGTTELAPITSVNIPPSRQPDKKFQVDAKEGTVGRPLPYVAAKVTHLDTGEELGPNQPGMLWIKGPNVMKGYLDMPEATAEVIIDGWYKTGDVALIDDDGFIKITGRMSRFSKIGGEMVPHLKIEEVLSRLLDETPNDDSDDHLLVAVTAVPDSKKGERLIVLYSKTDKSVEQMRESLKSEGLPNIFVPTEDSFFEIETIPILGTGKLDLKGIKDLAVELTSRSNQ